MPDLVVALLLAIAQQVPTATGLSSPPSGDTAGYWQQGIHYTIVATLDERAGELRATATLQYRNNSPDTLRELYVHQYLNAFRPGSRWSAADKREGRVRFQHLQEPDYGYERFTAPVRVNGQPAAISYPGAPDSTVARIALPAPLAPGDSAAFTFQWAARPSTVPRRQGRRGRHWDLAQWYPKVAVYDRGGWQHNPLQPAGELYGEYGTYDVTLHVAEDQVLAATGVPVAGDPGWGRALRSGVERRASQAYGTVAATPSEVRPGFKAVRFLARDVHHFAWSASPEFRYEGGSYARRARAGFRTWDTVSIHVLYRPGDDSTWGGQRVVRRTIAAMAWLEQVFGPYAYPQMTVMHRLDGGGTEFPMMQQNGSPSQGLILHEGGHVWAYGILGNNEWRSGWMDEGLTSYQTSWAQQLTAQERVRAGLVDRFAPATGYRARGVQLRLPPHEALNVEQAMADITGAAEPMGTTAHEFRDFNTYNDMVYSRAEVMFSQLRDAVGDSAFGAFLRDYYGRWALRHVDERAMRAAAERASGADLGVFFDQWVHRTGLMDYRLGRVRSMRDANGWITEADVIRRGTYQHPMSVGVRTASGWTLGRMTRLPYERETVRIRTAVEPLEVRLDPHHFSWDWDRRNDIRGRANPLRASGAVMNLDWPFLQQADRDRDVVLYAPMVWYSEPGGVAAGIRQRASYLGVVDRTEGGLAYLTDPPLSRLAPGERLQAWWRFENPYASWMRRPLIGLHGSVAHLDGLLRLDLGRTRERTAGSTTRVLDVTLAFVDVVQATLAPELWHGQTIDLSVRGRRQTARAGGEYSFVEPRVVVGVAGNVYGKAELAAGVVKFPDPLTRLAIRGFGGVGAAELPPQRAILLSAEDPMTTFWNHWWRPRGALLKRPGMHWLPLGGAALRGYGATVGGNSIAALNVDASRRLFALPRSNSLGVWAHAFGDAGWASDARNPLSDAGVGLSIRGRLYDKAFHLRLDAPVFVSRAAIAIGSQQDGQLAPRWVVTFTDLW
jgi:hypothetical protein